MTVTVYKISNTVNDKVYIGVTKYSLKHRWAGHVKDSQNPAKQHRSLFKAMNELGIDKFIIEPIENIEKEKGFEREKYWIEFYDSFYNGYNDTFGGAGRPIGDEEKIIEVYRKYMNMHLVAKELKICWDTVSAVLHKYNIPIKSSQQIAKDKVPNIAMYTLEGELLRVFECVWAAALFLNEKKGDNVQALRRHIPDVCRGKRKTAGGYVWKYTKKKPKVYIEKDNY